MIGVLVCNVKLCCIALKLFCFKSMLCNNAIPEGLICPYIRGFEFMCHVFVWMDVEGLLFKINQELSSNMTQFIFSLVQSCVCISEEDISESSMIISFIIPVHTQFGAVFHICDVRNEDTSKRSLNKSYFISCDHFLFNRCMFEFNIGVNII